MFLDRLTSVQKQKMSIEKLKEKRQELLCALFLLDLHHLRAHP